LIAYRWVEINEDGTRHVFAIAGFRKESLERTTGVDFLSRLRVETAINLEAMLEKVPGSVVISLVVGTCSWY
jgi:hypothetical protein